MTKLLDLLAIAGGLALAAWQYAEMVGLVL